MVVGAQGRIVLPTKPPLFRDGAMALLALEQCRLVTLAVLVWLTVVHPPLRDPNRCPVSDSGLVSSIARSMSVPAAGISCLARKLHVLFYRVLYVKLLYESSFGFSAFVGAQLC